MISDTFKSVILRTEVGSVLHGLAIEGTDDRDEMAIGIEHPRFVTGLGSKEHYDYRTAPQGQRSGPGDLDRIVYGLRKFMGLACKGNPSIILPLFAPLDQIKEINGLGQDLRGLTSAIISKQCGPRFLGYLHSQRLAAERGRGHHRGKREGRTGKWASHMLRLGYQGIEILETRQLRFPMAPYERNICLAAKTGTMPLDEAIYLAELLEKRIEKLIEMTYLPDKPDYEKIERWMHHAYLETWNEA